MLCDEPGNHADPPAAGFPMRSLLAEIALERFERGCSDEWPSYKISLGALEVEAAEVINRFFKPVLLIAGVCRTVRTIEAIEVEIPLQVVSREQGLALLAYYLARHVSDDVKPPWLREGIALAVHLPWNRCR